METMALVWTAAVVGAGVIYWFVWVMGAAEVKGKRAVDLKMGSITDDKVQDNYDQYWSFFRRPKETVEDKVPDFVDTFYNLVTDIYEWGWGQSFHFSPSIPGKSHRDATRIHEERVVDLIRARPGHRIVDVGCGVGGPMRAIAAKSGASVVGITINEYQVGRASRQKDGTLLNSSDFVKWHNGGGIFHTTASIDSTVVIETGAIVHSKSVIGADVHIGSGTVVGPSVTVGHSTRIGYNASLSNCSVGMSCIICNGVCIGQDGAACQDWE